MFLFLSPINIPLQSSTYCYIFSKFILNYYEVCNSLRAFISEIVHNFMSLSLFLVHTDLPNFHICKILKLVLYVILVKLLPSE